MTLLIASVRVASMDELIGKATLAWAGGAECVELRIDDFQGDPVDIAAYLEAHGEQRWILTCRSIAQGGTCSAGPLERAERLIAARGPSRATLDFEYVDFSGSPEVRCRLRSARDPIGGDGAIAEARPKPTESTGGEFSADAFGGILSHHRFDGPVPDVAALAGEIERVEPNAVPKVAYVPGDIADTFSALDAMHEARKPVIAIAMKEEGLWTRLLAKKLGAFGTYAALEESSATATGQIDLGLLRTLYHWSDIHAATRVFGVLGDPVAHSVGPRLFNHWFKENGVHAVYLPLRVSREGACLRRFLDGCRARPWLDVGGFSVTIPHKEALLDYAGSNADGMARSIGAANTLSLAGHRSVAFNTDCQAAMDSLRAALGRGGDELSGLSVAVLGCGGAARAVLAGLRESGCRVMVHGRQPEKTRDVAVAFGATALPWSERIKNACDVLINATPIGMWPDVESTPMAEAGLRDHRLVFDLVYNPPQTRLLREAEALGVPTLNGLDMFVRQAAKQFEIWTGQTPDLGAGHTLVSASLRQTQDGGGHDS